MPQTNFPIPVGNLVTDSAAIANGGTTSGTIKTGGLGLCALQLPAAFTGTAVSFLGSLDGVTFQPVHSTTSGSALSYTVAQGQCAAIDPTALQGIPYLQIVSNATEAAVRSIGYALKG